KQVEIDSLEAEIAELKALAKSGPRVIADAIPPHALITEAARARIAATALGQIRPQVFWSAARKASQTAIDAAARQDFDAAILAQQQQLLNLALFKAATNALAEMEQGVTYAKGLDTPASRKRIGLAGASYQDQIDGVLDRYQFATVSRKALERRASLRKWIASLQADGMAVELPEEILDDARRVNFKELTHEEFTGILDGLKQIVHLAQ